MVFVDVGCHVGGDCVGVYRVLLNTQEVLQLAGMKTAFTLLVGADDEEFARFVGTCFAVT